MKRKLKAKVVWQKGVDDREGYAINIYSQEYKDWCLDSFYPMTKSNGESVTNKMFFMMMNRLAYIQELGYEIDIL